MASLLRHPRVEPVVSRALVARCVRRPARFFAREQSGSSAIASYAVRGGRGALLTVQHRTPDVQVIDEIFYQGLYDPPVEVDAILRELGAGVRVLDLGGNVGMFGTWLAHRTAFASLISCEPDARNADLLQRTIDANVEAGVVAPGAWRLARVAAATHDGEVRFATGEFAMSHIVEGGETAANVVVVPCVDILTGDLADADVVKMDIEGGEWDVLADPRFPAAATKALVLEYHPEGCPADAPDPHAAARARLEAAGFTVRRIPQAAAPEGVGMAWAWR